MWEIRVTPAGDFDNHALDHEHIKVEPLSGAMGAEVVGVRLPELVGRRVRGAQAGALPPQDDLPADQFLTHAEHEAFGARLGPFAVDAYTQGVPGHREVHPIIKEAETKAAEPVRRRLAHRQPVPRGAAGDHHAARGRGPAVRRRHQLGQLRARLPAPEQDLPGHAAPAARAHERGEQLPHPGTS